ncbi:MAG: hypothetical protein ACT4QA_05880 [Panacagrimonas sp.]
MNPPRRSPPPGAVGAIVAALGFGVACWYGWDWYQIPRWTEAQIEQSVELNFVLDLKRTGAEPPSPDAAQAMREHIRSDLRAEIAKERELPRDYTLAGLVIGLFGLAQMFVRMALARRRHP